MTTLRIFALFMLLVPSLHAADHTPAGTIAFSVRHWQGEYRSVDVPGGVSTTEVVGSIYTIGADGSGLRKIAEPGRDTNAPAFSPDGRWLFFQSNALGSHRIYRCRPDGTELAPIISPEDIAGSWKSVYGLSVASRGNLVFTVHDGQSGRVAIADEDGTRPRVIAPDSGYRYMGTLGPDGKTLVCSGPASGYRLQKITLPEDSVTTLTPDLPDSFAPQFTPDGKTIVFFRRDGDLYRVDVDGRNLKRLTSGNQHVEFRLSGQDHHGSSDAPHVSPNGRKIAFVVDREGVSSVRTMNLDGRESLTLVEMKAPCARVRWSPNGDHIAFVSMTGKYPQLFTIPARGGLPRQLTTVDGAVTFACWQPMERGR